MYKCFISGFFFRKTIILCYNPIEILEIHPIDKSDTLLVDSIIILSGYLQVNVLHFYILKMYKV